MFELLKTILFYHLVYILWKIELSFLSRYVSLQIGVNSHIFYAEKNKEDRIK